MMEAKERLQAFLTAMTAWETWSHVEDRKIADDFEWEKRCDFDWGTRHSGKGQTSEERWVYCRKRSQESRTKLLAIFTEFLTQGAVRKIGRSRLGALNFGRPPQYAKEIEDEYEQNENHASVYAQSRDGSQPRTKYEMVIENEVWKIEAVFEWRPSSGKWSAVKAL